MKKIKIITDSASDIPVKNIKGITVLPMRISFSGEDFLDGVTISHNEFYERLINSSNLPTTSLIPPVCFEEEYKKAINKGEKVLVITISSKLSGTYQSAVSAADAFKGKVFVVDSLNATIGQQILVMYALKLIKQGLSIEAVVSELESKRNKIHIIGLLDTLEYLKQGGRISKTTAFVGGMLAIKPVVTIDAGTVLMLGKSRGTANGNAFVDNQVETFGGINYDMPYLVGYTGTDSNRLKDYLKNSKHKWTKDKNNINIVSIGSTIGTHIGPNGIAVAFFDNK